MSEDKIVVRNTAIIINDYNMGDSEPLENIFKIWNPTYHRFDTWGFFFDKDNHKLYLPSGLDLWKVRSYFGERYFKREDHHPYQEISNIQLKYKPRDEKQLEALKFTCGIDQYADNLNCSQLSINLPTGKGKTYISIATMAFYKMKTVIITASNTLLNQWEGEIKTYTNLKKEDIMHISGSDMINMILNGKSNKAKNAKVYLCSHGTLQSYGDTFGWDKVYELFKYLGIGLKFFDEAHTNFTNMMMIDFFTNVYKTFYVTATPGRSNWRENRIYQLSLKNVPDIDLFDEDQDPHTDYVAIKWNSRPTPADISRCKNQYGLDRMKYIDYVTKSNEFYKIMRIVMQMVLNCGGRALLYIGTNEALLRVYWWIGHEYPELLGDIGIFTSLLPKEAKMQEKQKKILLSTTKSAGLGEHIEGLKMTVVVAEPFKSEIIARQTLGRTRDSDTTYVELVDLGFRSIRSFYYSKLPVFNKYALSTSDTTIERFELERRAAEIKRKRFKWQTPAIVFCDDRFDFGDIIPHKLDDNIPKCPITFFDQKDVNPYIK